MDVVVRKAVKIAAYLLVSVVGSAMILFGFHDKSSKTISGSMFSPTHAYADAVPGDDAADGTPADATGDDSGSPGSDGGSDAGADSGDDDDDDS